MAESSMNESITGRSAGGYNQQLFLKIVMLGDSAVGKTSII